MVIACWAGWLSRDITREDDRRAEEIFDEELRKIEESVLGYSNHSNNNFDND